MSHVKKEYVKIQTRYKIGIQKLQGLSHFITTFDAYRCVICALHHLFTQLLIGKNDVFFAKNTKNQKSIRRYAPSIRHFCVGFSAIFNQELQLNTLPVNGFFAVAC